jgi:hypothetical protein
MSQRPELDHLGARRVVRPSPPVDFALYGLEASWPGARWLEMFGLTEERSGKHADWPLVPWHVDGTAVTARMWQFGPADARPRDGRVPRRAPMVMPHRRAVVTGMPTICSSCPNRDTAAESARSHACQLVTARSRAVVGSAAGVGRCMYESFWGSGKMAG